MLISCFFKGYQNMNPTITKERVSRLNPPVPHVPNLRSPFKIPKCWAVFRSQMQKSILYLCGQVDQDLSKGVCIVIIQ